MVLALCLVVLPISLCSEYGRTRPPENGRGHSGEEFCSVPMTGRRREEGEGEGRRLERRKELEEHEGRAFSFLAFFGPVCAAVRSPFPSGNLGGTTGDTVQRLPDLSCEIDSKKLLGQSSWQQGPRGTLPGVTSKLHVLAGRPWEFS